jgi:predicted transcriptional regulator
MSIQNHLRLGGGFSILKFVQCNQGKNQSRIFRETHTTNSVGFDTFKQLLEKKLITRKNNVSAREYTIYITKRGDELCEYVKKIEEMIK